MQMKKKRLSLIVASVLAMSMSAPVLAKVVHDGQSSIVDNDDSSESHIGGQYWLGVQPDTYVENLTTSMTLTRYLSSFFSRNFPKKSLSIIQLPGRRPGP